MTKTTKKTVDAEVWQISVCEGSVAMVHGCTYSINEYYIPKYHLAFNIVNDHLNILKTKGERYSKDNRDFVGISPIKKKDIKISESFAMSLKKYLKLKDTIKNEAIDIVIKSAIENSCQYTYDRFDNSFNKINELPDLDQYTDANEHN